MPYTLSHGTCIGMHSTNLTVIICMQTCMHMPRRVGPLRTLLHNIILHFPYVTRVHM